MLCRLSYGGSDARRTGRAATRVPEIPPSGTTGFRVTGVSGYRASITDKITGRTELGRQPSRMPTDAGFRGYPDSRIATRLIRVKDGYVVGRVHRKEPSCAASCGFSVERRS